jgi:hypothetical protein
MNDQFKSLRQHNNYSTNCAINLTSGVSDTMRPKNMLGVNEGNIE